MAFNVNLTEKDVENYRKYCVNRIFAILGIFEDCQKTGNMETLNTYLNRLITEFTGVSSVFNMTTLIPVVGILQGMKESENLQHKEVKSLVFHCISIVKKAEASE